MGDQERQSMSYWVTFADRSPGCVENDLDAAQFGKVLSIDSLPYPASPQLTKGSCPPFCFQPQRCKGRSSCPRDYACSE